MKNMLAKAKYPLRINAAPMSADNPDTVRDWTGAYWPPENHAEAQQVARVAFGRRLASPVNKGE